MFHLLYHSSGPQGRFFRYSKIYFSNCKNPWLYRLTHILLYRDHDLVSPFIFYSRNILVVAVFIPFPVYLYSPPIGYTFPILHTFTEISTGYPSCLLFDARPMGVYLTACQAVAPEMEVPHFVMRRVRSCMKVCHTPILESCTPVARGCRTRVADSAWYVSRKFPSNVVRVKASRWRAATFNGERGR